MIALRPFAEADLPAAYAMTFGFGWPHRPADWAFSARLGSGLAAEKDGALIGTAFAWPAGAIGLIGVTPPEQRKGLGRRLTTAVLDGLAGRPVVLHATASGLPLYRSLGFAVDGTVRQIQGAPFAVGLVPLPPGRRLRPAGRGDSGPLAALDRAATGLDRAPIVHALLEGTGGVVLDGDGAPLGFALVRRFGRGKFIGPVVAPDRLSAQAMVGHLLARHAGAFVRIDVPEEAGLTGWLLGLGLGDAGPAIRMVRGTLARPGPVSTFALAGQSFG